MQPEEVKALRMEAGLSQAELAELIGMSRVTVGLMERGAAPIERRTELAIRYVVEVIFGEN
jgi:DNA-binding XRE family transcriptional regulator